MNFKENDILICKNDFHRYEKGKKYKLTEIYNFTNYYSLYMVNDFPLSEVEIKEYFYSKREIKLKQINI